jgi:hypothetical protein
LNGISAKPYTDISVGGRLEHLNISGPINITRVNFINMHNVDYQKDWLKSITHFQLTEFENYRHSVLFNISNGLENEWVTKFREYELVQSTRLRYESRRMNQQTAAAN